MSASAVYEGWVRHRRFEPVEHAFRYRLFLMYLDLDELPRLLDRYPLWSARRPAPARFRRADYMGDPERPLAECARDAVEEQTGSRPAGPVRLLANLRYLGHVFNPVSFYYCFDGGGERVEAVVADVNNIPWGERHPYVLARGGRQGTVLAHELDKALHVSPLMGMEQTYAFRAERARRAAQRPDRVAPQRTARQGLRRDALAAPPRAQPAAADRDARPLPGDVAAGRRQDLRPGAAAEAEGRALLPPSRREAAEGVPLAVRDRLARTAVQQALRRLRAGRIEVIEDGRRRSFGPAGAELRATVTIHDPAAWRGAAARQRRARRDLRRRPLGDRRPGRADPHRRPRAAPARRPARRRRPPARPAAPGAPPRPGEHPRRGARQQHRRPLRPRQRALRLLPRRADDLLLRLLPEPDASLEEAQLAKLERICEQLRLGPENHLLEIGSGWGGLAIHAAREHGCRVTTTTISRRAARAGQQRVREAGLEDRVDGAAARTTATCAAATTGWSRSR